MKNNPTKYGKEVLTLDELTVEDREAMSRWEQMIRCSSRCLRLTVLKALYGDRAKDFEE